MTKNTYKCLAIFFCVSSLILMGFGIMVDRDNRRIKDELSTIKNDLAHTDIPMLCDTIRDSIPVIQQKVITIDKTDYKQQVADRQLIKDLQLRVAQVESENQTLLATHGQAQLVASADTDTLLRYHDRWCDFLYHVPQRTLDYTVTDSITTIVSRIYKHKFLWFRWGTKGYQLHTVNHNPHSSVKYNRYIKVER